MTEDTWLVKHPYLQGIADFLTLVKATWEEIPVPSADAPKWNNYIGDFHAGIPLLRSSWVAIDFHHAEMVLTSLVQNLASNPLPGNLADESRALRSELGRHLNSVCRAVRWLIEKDSFVPSHPGLLHYLGWTVLARCLQPLAEEFATWRDEERWLRSYCPLCGSLPAMAQLVGTDPGRLRLLSCGHCTTRWRYRRTGCPFCENENDHRLRVLVFENEGGLRIDYCEACTGYLKTYNGEGSEGVMLADWTSLHLDIVARDRGLKRCAGSLYQL
jgi:FdhE protein